MTASPERWLTIFCTPISEIIFLVVVPGRNLRGSFAMGLESACVVISSRGNDQNHSQHYEK